MKKILFVMILLTGFLSGCEPTTVVDDGKKVDERNNDVNEKDIYVIEFNTNGGSSIADIEVESGKYIALPIFPTKDGFEFDGWYTDVDLTDPFNAGAPIERDTTLYAKWDEVDGDVTITFVSEYGTSISPIVAKAGSTISKPTDPTDDFYVFVQWVIQGTTTAFDWDSGMPEDDVTLVAQWENPPTYQVIFHPNNGESMDLYYGTRNSSITIPMDLERDGYVFDGWYQESTFQTKQNETLIMPNEDVHLYAKWISYDDYYYNVSFEHTGDVYIEPISQVVGTPISEPETPIKQGYLFDGWYEDDSYSTAFDFQVGYNDDQVVYAKWVQDPSLVQISFETNGGSEMDSIFTEPNVAVVIPKTTLKDGHMLLGWYKDEAFTQAVYTTLSVSENTTLYAKWHEQANVVYIFFNSTGGSDVDPYQKRPGQGIAAPSEPTKPGYDFSGWYEDEEYTRRYYFMAMGNETITLYAKWQKIELQHEEVTNSLEATVSGWGFVCVEHVCEYEVSTGYTYIFDFNTNVFAYHKVREDEDENGYRNYFSVVTINEEWDVTYTFHVEEDYGYYFSTDVILSGNYETATYTIDSFESNIQSEEARKEAAIETINHFADFVKSVLEAANLSMEDLG